MNSGPQSIKPVVGTATVAPMRAPTPCWASLALAGSMGLAGCGGGSGEAGLSAGAPSAAAPTTSTGTSSTVVADELAAIAAVRAAPTRAPTATPTLAPTPAPTPAPVVNAAVATFPLSVVSGKRHLVDAAGSPYMLRGEAAWGLITKLKREDVDVYLEDRRAKGFNAVVVMLVSHHYLIGPQTNVYGAEPFTTPGDFSTPNEAYFSHADYVIAKAAEKGMLVVLAPAYLGYFGSAQQGWLPMMTSSGVAKMRAYGNYVGNRYKNQKNILWLNGGDDNPGSLAEMDLVRAVANGIRDVIPNALQTFHGVRGTAALQYWGSGEPWLTVNDIYTHDYDVVASARGEYARSTLPFFLVEAVYERNGSADAQVVRQQAYQAALSGSLNSVFGLEGLWQFGSDWSTLLNTGGALSMAPLAKIFSAIKWWDLQPDATGTFLTAGISSGRDQAAAALASDRSFGMAYMPTLRSVTMDLSKLAGPKVQVQWIDPVNGSVIPAVGSPFPALGKQVLQPAGANSGGKGDWVMKLNSIQ